jgi:hypothetical protein
MANVKITELTAATALAGTDVLPIVDVGADATKKVSVSDLLRNLPDGTASAPALAFADDQNTGVLSPAANELAFATSGTQRLVIDSSGQIGIGTSSPENNLHIADTSGPIIRLTNSTGTDGTYTGRISTGDAAGTFFAGINFFKHDTNDGEIRFRTKVDGTNQDTVTIVDGRVGIGTTSPTELLHTVKGSGTSRVRFEASAAHSFARLVAGSTSYNSGVEFFSGTTNTANITAEGDGELVVEANGSERMRIDSSGRVGIGTSAPSTNLDIVVASGTATQKLGSSSVSGGSYTNYHGASGTKTWFVGSNYNVGGALEFFQSTTNGGTTPSSTPAMVIDSSGRLLVGTTSGTGKFIVQDSSLPKIQANFNGTKHMEFGVGGSGCGFVMTTGHFMTFNHQPYADRGTDNNLTERMRIDSSGNLLIGRTTAGATGNGHTIRGGDSAIFSRSATGETVQICRNDSTGDLLQFRRNNVVCGEVVNTGATTVAYNTSSDYRLKENVVALLGGIDRVKQLKPSRFNFITEPEKTVDGFIAHEAQIAVPECATGVKDWVDEEGNPKMQGIDQSKLVPLLTAALQEAIAKIETLETKVAALEAQ